MNQDYRLQAQAMPAGAMDMSVDTGLRAFMLGVYSKMALGLVVSGLLAFATYSVEPVRNLLFTPAGGYTMIGLGLSFAPLILLLVASFAMRNPSRAGAGLVYWTIVSLIGAGLGVLAIRYTGESIAQTFFITAASFGALSLWGYTTKKDLTGFGSFLIMGLFGMILASLVNTFVFQSGLMQMVISLIGVLVFAGLTAFDTQRLKFTYYALAGDDTALSVATSFGALSLYLNFINLFQLLLSLFGDRE